MKLGFFSNPDIAPFSPSWLNIRHKSFALATSISISLAGAAHGSEAIVKKYQELAEQNGGQLTYERYEELDGDAFNLHGVKIKPPKADSKPLTIEMMHFEGARELEGNGIAADVASFENLAFEAPDDKGKVISFTFDHAKVEGLYFPDPSKPTSNFFYDGKITANLGPMRVAIDGKNAFVAPSIISEFVGNKADKTMSGFAKMNDMEIIIDNMPDGEKARAQLGALGYDQLKIDVNIALDWDMNTGIMNLNEYKIGLKDMGAINLQMSVGGYDETMFNKLRAMNVQMSAMDPATQMALGLKTQAEMAKLTLNSAKISFSDASITNKIIAMFAQGSGQNADDMKAALPFMLAQAMQPFQMEALTQKFVGVAKAFLANPGTVSITAKPETAITFGELADIGKSNPVALVEKLNVDAENE